MRIQIAALFIGLGVIYYAAVTTGNGQQTYFDSLSFMIVFGGTLCVSFMTHGPANSLKMFRLFFKQRSKQVQRPEVIKQLVGISTSLYQGDGPEARPGSLHPFIIEGLRLIENRFETEQLKMILKNNIQEEFREVEKSIERLEGLAKYPPAFGMMGTIIGLVAVLKQINNPDNMTLIGPSMAVALITTLYGILLSNYVLQPIADSILLREQEEIVLKELMAEGILLIAQGQDPILTRELLLSKISGAEKVLVLKEYQKKQDQREAA
jgi:chemotaxis protein MotA